jgi:serine/threonine-protein kinase
MADVEPPAMGQRFGAYRTVEEVGRGGMGIVYRAVRDDDEFQQTVAVKVLPGAVFSRKAMERFRNERRILAGLEHPNIARLIDGGTTPQGVPYVIIEYVDGLPVDRYCEERGLDLEARIWLFLALCDAVQYAHRNLVVHRDLKPSNILVTRDGVPKLLDFGIAKLVDPADDAGGVTMGLTQSRVMTPAFASPEQLTGRRIATPSDVYSLGVLLYRLLTGRHPYGDDTASSGSSSTPADLLRRLLEGEPAAPSAVSGDRRIRGDLDAIVLAALRRDPSERYDSVQALADDLRRYLTGRPVGARGDSWRYRAGKFVRRNAPAVLAGAAAAALLIGEAGVFLRRLAQERDVARQEAARATATLTFLTDVFRVTDPFVSNSGDLTAREVLERGVAGLDDRLASQPEVRAEILSTLGTAYANLGVMDSARAVLERGLALRDSIYAPDALEMATGLRDLGTVLQRQDRIDRADTLLGRALAIRRERLPADHPDIASLLDELAGIQRQRGDLPGAERTYREALAILEHPSEPRDALHAQVLTDLGNLLHALDRLEEADDMLERALVLRRTLYGDRHPEVGQTLNHLSLVRSARGEYREAERILRDILTWGPEVLGEHHHFVAIWNNNLATILKDQGRQREALDHQRKALDIWRAEYGDMHSQVATGLNNLANLQSDLGDYAAAERALEEALRINRTILGDDTPKVATNLNNLAHLAWKRRDWDAAIRAQTQVLEMDRRLLGPEHEYVAGDLTALGAYHLAAGRLDRAEAPLREGLALSRKVRGDDHPVTARAATVLADWLVARGRGSEAAELVRPALETRLRAFDPDHASVALSRSTLGAALTLEGDYRAAETQLTQAEAAMATSLPEDDPNRVRNRDRLAALYEAWGRPAAGPGR